MTEDGRRERERRRHRRAARRRLFGLAMIALAAVILWQCKPWGQAGALLGRLDSLGAGSSDQARAKDGKLHLTDADSRTGDLILVSADHPYDFDANAGVELTKVAASQSSSYPVDPADMKLAAEVISPLERMLKACDRAVPEGQTGLSSGYRDKEYQRQLYDRYAKEYGEDYAESYVAQPGCSEHHTGLAFDLGVTYGGDTVGSFSSSEKARWMADHAWEYGFIRRYTEDKTDITGISNEAWHFRYVGLPHAAYMRDNDLCLEEYLSYLQSSTSPDAPLSISCSGGNYRVFYTASPELAEPEGTYAVSGDNMGGWIITVGP